MRHRWSGGIPSLFWILASTLSKTNLEGEGLASKGLYEHLNATGTMQMQDQVEGRLFLSVTVGQCVATLKLLSGEDEMLLIMGNSMKRKVSWWPINIDSELTYPPCSIVGWSTSRSICVDSFWIDEARWSDWVISYSCAPKEIPCRDWTREDPSDEVGVRYGLLCVL